MAGIVILLWFLRRKTDGSTPSRIKTLGLQNFHHNRVIINIGLSMTFSPGPADPSSSPCPPCPPSKSCELASFAQEPVKALFLAHLSHELKTSLSSVLGAGELLGSTKLDTEQARLLRLMQGAGVHLMQLLDEVLDHSQLSAQRLTLRTDFHEAVALMEKSIQWFDPLAQAKGLKLYVWMDLPEGCTLNVDALRLTQVFSNLLSNAIKFTASGHVLVHAQVQRQGVPSDEPKDQLVVKFIDTGPGIAKEDWPHLFLPFSQVGDTNRAGTLGTGLGLSIAHQLTALMGGQLRVSSVLGEGSVFELSLPLLLKSDEHHDLHDRHDRLESLDRADFAHLVQALQARLDAPQGLSLGLWFEDPLLQTALELQLTALNLPWHALHPTAQSKVALSGIITDAQELPSQVKNFEPYLAQHLPIIEVKSERLNRIAAHPDHPPTLLITPFSRAELKLALRQAWRLKATPVELNNDSKARTHLQGVRVLLVEDNPTLLLVYQTLLESMGCVCQLAKDGQEALQRVLNSPDVDLVLMDCHLPLMDGFEATQAIRLWERECHQGQGQVKNKRLPIIALTASDAPQDQVKSLECGMDDFCAKPVSRAELYSVIKKACSV